MKKYISFLLVFVFLLGVGFYLGSRSPISGQGLLFAEVESRSPASSATQFQNAVQNLSVEKEGTVLYLISEKLLDSNAEVAVSICSGVENGAKYSVTYEAQGVSEHGEPVELFVEGECLGQQKIVIFDDGLCDAKADSIGAFYSSRGVNISVRGKKLSFTLKKYKFLLKKVGLELRNGFNQEVKIEQAKEISFHCPGYQEI